MRVWQHIPDRIWCWIPEAKACCFRNAPGAIRLVCATRWLSTTSSLIVLVLASGCATIPKESVTLSEKLGNGMEEQVKAHVNLVNVFFDQKQAALERWIENEYIPKYIGNIRAELKAADENPDLITEKMATDIFRDIANERDKRHSDLEKTRAALLARIEKNRAVLAHANAQLTGLLQSAVNVREATHQIEKTLAGATGLDVDFAALEKKFDDYLINAGNLAGKGKTFYEEVKPLIEK